MTGPENNEFEAAGKGKQTGLVAEIVEMLRESKKYWLIPIIAVLFVLGALVILSSTAAAPFIYTLF